MSSKNSPSELLKRREELLRQANESAGAVTAFQEQADRINAEIAAAERQQLELKQAELQRQKEQLLRQSAQSAETARALKAQALQEFREREEKLALALLKDSRALAEGIDELLALERDCGSYAVLPRWSMFVAVRQSLAGLAHVAGLTRPDLVGKGILPKRGEQYAD